MRKHDEQRMESVVGMVDRRDRRERDASIHTFGPLHAPGHVFRGPPEFEAAWIEEWTVVSGKGADGTTVGPDGRVCREWRP